jgi:signal transduction histidine kinase
MTPSRPSSLPHATSHAAARASPAGELGDQGNPYGSAAQELQRAGDYHEVLLAMAGHDLRQPLQIIAGVHSWLARRVNTSGDREYLRRGELAIAQLIDQLDQLVDALRLDGHAAGIDLQPVEVDPIFTRVCQDSTTLAAQKGVTIRLCHTRARAMSNAVLLEGILRNLTRNALKYTQPGGRVLVGCHRRGPDIGMEVYDTGVGISPDHVQKVFEAFRQLDSTRSDGLGLGLFVVRRAADLLRHRIGVRSRVGRGSCFSVFAAAARA